MVPLVVVWEGVGLGAGGVGGGFTVGLGVALRLVGAGVGRRALEVARLGAAAVFCLACARALWLGDG